jgi:hypothetical protein
VASSQFAEDKMIQFAKSAKEISEKEDTQKSMM